MNSTMNHTNASLDITYRNDSQKTDLYDPPLVEEEIYDVPTHIIAILSTCYGSISLMAVLGNGLVVWVIFSSGRMKNVTNYYIANLAIADIIIGLFSIPFEFQAALLQRWTLPDFMCSFCPFVKTVSVCASVFTLAAIAVDRQRAVVKPFTSRVSKVQFKLVISLIWVVSVIIGFPWLYVMGVKEVQDKKYGVRDFCYHVRSGPDVMLAYRASLVVFQYVIPVSVITWVYARMGLALWGATAPGNAQSDRDENIMRNKKKVIKMLIIVVALFAFCWLPLQMYNLLHPILPSINSFRYINIIWFCMDWLAMSNSCYNPFIYAICNEKFKREYKKRLGVLCCKDSHRRDQFSHEMSALDSSRYEWRRTSTINSKLSTRNTSITLQ